MLIEIKKKKHWRGFFFGDKSVKKKDTSETTRNQDSYTKFKKNESSPSMKLLSLLHEKKNTHNCAKEACWRKSVWNQGFITHKYIYYNDVMLI